MKYEYIGAMGKTEIEVDEYFHEMLIKLDREEYNLERKHSRRYPLSIEDADYEGEWFSDGTDLLGDLIRTETYEYLHAALAELTPDQQKLIDQVYFKNVKIVDIANEQGVSQPAISQRLATAIKKLKKLL